jgi:hypothetical protein
MVVIDGALLYQTGATNLKILSSSSFLIIYNKQVEIYKTIRSLSHKK